MVFWSKLKVIHDLRILQWDIDDFRIYNKLSRLGTEVPIAVQLLVRAGYEYSILWDTWKTKPHSTLYN